MASDIKKITENLIKLQQAYAFSFRATISEERRSGIVESGLLKKCAYDSKLIREPLIEHVGHLPIIASYLYSYIEHKNKVDLGRVLIMLSVHDIGEIKVGDVFTYSKFDYHDELERKAAKKLLPRHLYEYFDEFDKVKTADAKFAKAVDSIAPLLREMVLTKDALKGLFKHYNFDVDKIIDKKKSDFEWDAVLSAIFDYLIKKYRKIEKNQP